MKIIGVAAFSLQRFSYLLHFRTYKLLVFHFLSAPNAVPQNFVIIRAHHLKVLMLLLLLIREKQHCNRCCKSNQRALPKVSSCYCECERQSKRHFSPRGGFYARGMRSNSSFLGSWISKLNWLNLSISLCSKQQVQF